MDNGIYISLSRQLALFRDMEVTANNIANANTTGYNSEQLLFESFLSKDITQGTPNSMAMAYTPTSRRNTETGALSTTGNPLDVAIRGNGYFAVETPQGTRYTRAGNFTVSEVGVLMTAEGYPVLDTANQQITIPEDAVTIDIGSIGNIKVNGEELANIGVVQFEDEQQLERTDATMFTTEQTPVAADLNTIVAQGMIEGSNVQPVLEMTHMIDVSRSVGNTAKFIEAMYDLQRKAATAWVKQGA